MHWITFIFVLLAVAALGAWGLINRNRARKLAEQRAREENECLDAERSLAHEKAMAEAKAHDDARQQTEVEERSRREVEARENARLAEEQRVAAEKLIAESDAKRRAEEKALADAQVREAARLKAEVEATQRAEAEAREKARMAAEEEHRAEERRRVEEQARAEAKAKQRAEAEDREKARLAAEEAQRTEESREAEVREKMQMAAEEEARRQANENVRPAGLTHETGDSAEKPLNGGVGRVRTKRKPGRYRGLQRRPTVAAAKNNSGASVPVGNPTGLATFRVLVQLTFAPRGGGVKAVRLIPYCSKAAPKELEVIDTATDDILRFTKLRDDCFTPIALAEVSEPLAKGVRWVERSDSPNWCWAFGGRSLYVFAPGDGFGFSGFISTECLLLNERHVVMLKSELRDKVSAALREAGCSTFDILDETSSGVPQGWLVFKEVSPTRPVPRRDGDHVFNALCPLPNIKPDFVGGIRLERNTWLAGYPPRIRFTGVFANGCEVKIDDLPAQPASDGAFEVPGWDSEGEHRLWFGDRAETYSLRTMDEAWEHWPAHNFGTGAAICGAGTSQLDATRRRQVRVPVSNLLLIGARSGEIFHCQSRSDVRCETILAMVSFMPVWALPLDPAHADKESARILLFHPSEPLAGIQMPTGNRAAIHKLRVWISAIREAGCKGLSLTPADEQTKALWRRYRVMAKELRRKMR